jgi:pimeloyl-ACP methyl ester carboxylesterase
MYCTTSKDGTIIAFDRAGQGPALIMVVGSAATRDAVAGLSTALAPYFTVFAYDRRGRGDSGDTAPYADQREVEDIEALIDDAGGSAFVFGHSTGAVLALEAARLLSPTITKLVLYEPPFLIDNSRPPTREDYVSHLSELLSSGRRVEAIADYMQGVGFPAELMVQMQKSPLWPGIEALAHTVVYDATIMGDTLRGNPLSIRKWSSVTAPTLIIDGTVFCGSTDLHGFLRHSAQELAWLLPHTQRCTLEGQDHGPVEIIDIDLLAPVLKEFLLA